MEPVTVYLDTFEKLRRQKRWTTNTMVLRFAALTLASLDLADPHGDLETTATTLRKGAGWFGPLNSEIRYVVAAMILRKGRPAKSVHAEVKRTRTAFRKHRLPRSGIPATMASLILVLEEEGRSVRVETLARMERIYRSWKADHRWITGADDLPMAALHAVRDESVESLSTHVEVAYRRLRDAGFSRGNQLQFVSHVLALDPRGVDEAVGRFRRIATALKNNSERTGTSRYDEMAILALTSADPASVVRTMLSYRDRLRKARRRPSAVIAFSLAAGMAMAEDAERGAKLGDVRDLAALQQVQAILAAQQAAVIAAVAASTAAASAAH
jgi:hypothetical protein